MYLLLYYFLRGFQQETLETLNDPKFDLVNLRTLNSDKVQQNGLENPEKFPKDFHSIKTLKMISFFKLISRGQNDGFEVGNIWLKKWIGRCLSSQNVEVDHTDNLSVFKNLAID